MVVYADLVVLLNFIVDLMLFMGTNRLAGYACNWKREVAAAVVGALYAGACILPDFHFLGNLLWRIVSLVFMSVIAFGLDRSAFRRGILFTFLSMALGGIAASVETNNFLTLMIAAAGVFCLCFFGFRGKAGRAHYAEIELSYAGKTKKFRALRDTGNMLRDPITGHPVLVVGADIAWDCFGLSREQLQNPISSIERLREMRFRLIPYRAVGQSGGMLLGIKFDAVKVDGKLSDALVAFAPEELDRGDGYQALAGGML